MPLLGADIEIESDLPAASGLSSSSALTVGLFLALADRNELWKSPEWASSLSTVEDLAAYLGCLENGRSFRNLAGDEGVGTLSGNEDHTAILCSRHGEISQYRFCPVQRERSIALGPGWGIAIAASGVPSDKTGSVRERFNRLALSIATLRDLWNRRTGRSEESLFGALTRDPEEAVRFRSHLRRESPAGFPADSLLSRLDQLFEESAEIIPRVGDLLERGDVAGTGPLVDRSQELAEKILENQVVETVALQRSARALGALSSSAFGGGFGGSVWALVETTRGDEFLHRWREEYIRAFPTRARDSRFFLTGPGGPATRVAASGAHPWRPGKEVSRNWTARFGGEWLLRPARPGNRLRSFSKEEHEKTHCGLPTLLERRCRSAEAGRVSPADAEVRSPGAAEVHAQRAGVVRSGDPGAGRPHGRAGRLEARR